MLKSVTLLMRLLISSLFVVRLERGYGSMTFANTVRSALDLSINFTFHSNGYLDTLDLLDLAFQRRLRACIHSPEQLAWSVVRRRENVTVHQLVCMGFAGPLKCL
ncbi:hypothetical protein F5888DRAFT_757816 [Russula emetica]|nr:hypothetical protein F5888DRAFT_757816 [Russula emetica]